MGCEYLGQCGGCVADLSLEEKVSQASRLLNVKEFEVFSSKQDSFRARAELAIFHQNDRISYAMRSIKRDSKSHLVCIENCPNLSCAIQKTLPILLESLNAAEFQDFRDSLFALEILANQTGALLLSFLYHRKLESSWLIQAQTLKSALQDSLGFSFELVGRSRGVKLVVENDFLIETLRILGQDYCYRYDEGAFTQPNVGINIKMIEWILEHLGDGEQDLLELYCGCGNFTIPLVQKFRKVLATEISKTSIKAAKYACRRQGISHIEFVRLSGAECIEAINQTREFKRLRGICLSDYCFSAVLVDPPRAGLGEQMCSFLRNFPRILYVSCNPITLKKDLESLLQTHVMERIAFFDQFPHTQHLESIVILKVKSP